MGKSYEPRERKSKQTGDNKPKPQVNGQFSHRFVNPHLSTADEGWLSDNLDAIDTICLELIHEVGEDYSFSVTYDAKSGRYNAMLKCVAGEHANTGLILSVRGATAIDAMYALSYLHMVKSEGLWGTILPETNLPAKRWG